MYRLSVSWKCWIQNQVLSMIKIVFYWIQLKSLSFNDVSFSYPNGEEAVLKNIDFSCHKGQKFAVIGSTGSGKSTLVKVDEPIL